MRRPSFTSLSIADCRLLSQSLLTSTATPKLQLKCFTAIEIPLNSPEPFRSIDAADDLAVALRYPRSDSYLAAQALLVLGPDITATTIPLLNDNLRDDKSGTRIYPMILLASVGPRAACAVGNIAPLLWDPDPIARSATALALQRIIRQDLMENDGEISITPSFTAGSLSPDTPEGSVVNKARSWWNAEGSQVNWHPSYGLCDP